jgi:hypothetical protein
MTQILVYCAWESKTKNEKWLFLPRNIFLGPFFLPTIKTSVSSSMAWAPYKEFKPTTIK